MTVLGAIWSGRTRASPRSISFSIPARLSATRSPDRPFFNLPVVGLHPPHPHQVA